MPSVLIGTPAYGGLVTVPYLKSLMEIRDSFDDVDFLVTSGESHITRGRNNIVTTFLATNFDTLAFIDADIQISVADFGKLKAMQGVRGAAVACKTPDRSERLSIYPVLSRSEMPAEPFTVEFLGSAVLFIPRSVFVQLQEWSDPYDDPIVGQSYTYFWDGVVGNDWLSEDYGFCSTCRQAGIEIWCEPTVQVSHYGTMDWRF